MNRGFGIATLSGMPVSCSEFYLLINFAVSEIHLICKIDIATNASLNLMRQLLVSLSQSEPRSSLAFPGAGLIYRLVQCFCQVGLQPGQEALEFKYVRRIFGLGHQKIVSNGELRGQGVRRQAYFGFGMNLADDPRVQGRGSRRHLFRQPERGKTSHRAVDQQLSTVAANGTDGLKTGAIRSCA